MKIFILTFIFFILFFQLKAQVTGPLSNYKGKLFSLDSCYQVACNSDISESVFTSKEEISLFLSANKKMTDDLKLYIISNNFKFETHTKCIFRIYYNKNGGVDYLIYNFIDSTHLDKNTFKILLDAFVSEYRIDISSQVNFRHMVLVKFE